MDINILTFADLASENKNAEYLFWVGSAGSYDDRAKKVTRAFAKILTHCQIDFAILGTEESDSGDAARRAGNEFLFQMQAMQNIETLNMYKVEKIITCDPHDYNTIKNEYPDLGGNYKIWHHTEFILDLLKTGELKIPKGQIKNKNVSYHDPCYLSRGNNIYKAPREVIKATGAKNAEMKQNKQRSLCCGAGGSQMFKEAERGSMEVYNLRIKDVLEVNPEILLVSCPFCMTMLSDGIKVNEKQNGIEVMDIAELIQYAIDI